ncbi:MAG: MATE family efflux transporter [Oscillospiraceae bacterium]|nr:MATE family efflux transporter [Oscillospiraceae bacterium]
MSKQHGLDLTQGDIKRLLVRFALPFALSGIVSAFYGMADMFFIGQYCSEEVLAGVGNGANIMQIVYTGMMAISAAGSVLVGRRVGERDDKECAKATGTFLFVGVLLAVFSTLLIIALRAPMLSILKVVEVARPSASRYVIYCIPGLPFIVGFNVIGAIARGLGNSTAPSIVGVIGCVANIALDWLFTGVFGWAELGVAVATSISQLITFVVIGIWILRVKFPYKFTKRDFRIDGASFRSIFRVGIPLWMQELLVHISFLIIAVIVNMMDDPLTKTAVAAASVAVVSKIFTLGALFPASISQAVAAMTAQNIGAGRRDRAFASMKWGVIFSLAIDAAIVLWWQIAPTSVTSLFANEEGAAVILSAAAYLRSFSLDMLLIALIFPINSYLSGCGKSYVSMLHSMIATFAVRIPLSILFSRSDVFLTGDALNHKLYMLGLAAPIASVLSIVICAVYVYRQQRQWRTLDAAV